MTAWTAEREQELRASGWSDAEVRDYKRGYEQALAKAQAPLPPALPPERRPEQWFPVQQHYPRNSELGVWQRSTFARQVSTLFPLVEDAEDLTAAKAMQDDHEYRYNTRPPLGAFLAAIRHARPRGMTLSGTTPEVAGMLRNAGVAVKVAESYDPPQVAAPPKITRV